MKHVLSMILALLLVCGTLAGCQPREEYISYEGIPVIEPPPPTLTMSHRQAAILNPLVDHRGTLAYDHRQFKTGFLETDFASYCTTKISGDPDLILLLVLPKESDRFMPLCSGNDCSHDNDDCHAAVAFPQLGYMDGRICAIAHCASYSVSINLPSAAADCIWKVWNPRSRSPHPRHRNAER